MAWSTGPRSSCRSSTSRSSRNGGPSRTAGSRGHTMVAESPSTTRTCPSRKLPVRRPLGVVARHHVIDQSPSRGARVTASAGRTAGPAPPRPSHTGSMPGWTRSTSSTGSTSSEAPKVRSERAAARRCSPRRRDRRPRCASGEHAVGAAASPSRPAARRCSRRAPRLRPPPAPPPARRPRRTAFRAGRPRAARGRARRSAASSSSTPSRRMSAGAPSMELAMTATRARLPGEPHEVLRVVTQPERRQVEAHGRKSFRTRRLRVPPSRP